MQRPMSMSNTSMAYFSPSCIASPLGLVTMRMIPSGQYLAQLAQPVHRCSYQLNSSPLKRGCWGSLSATDSSPTSAFSARPGRVNAKATTFVPSRLARPGSPMRLSGYWCSVNLRLGSTRFFNVTPRPLTMPIPYILAGTPILTFPLEGEGILSQPPRRTCWRAVRGRARAV